MHFNVEKCHFMSVTRKINPHRYDYTMNGKSLLKVSQFKDLGIIITDNMTWDTHIGTIVKKANRIVWLIKRTMGFHAPLRAKKTAILNLN